VKQRFHGVVADVAYTSTTVNGNNRYRVHFQDGHSYVTAPDSSAGLDAQNLRVNDKIEVDLDAKQRITHIERT